MAGDFQVVGTVAAAPFTLKLHRGDGMCLLAMNWKNNARPPDDFVGFAIEYREPGADRYFVLRNRLTFSGVDPKADPNQLSTKLSPVQKFRWVHFPQNANLQGDFAYRVTPVFMNAKGELSYGVAQEAAVALARETYPGQLDVGFTRGFVSSQAFVDRFEPFGDISTLLPSDPSAGLNFKATHPKAKEAYDWMGFEARKLILGLLDEALADTTAKVCIACYELNVPEIVDRLTKLGARLQIIIDDSVDKNGRGNGAANSDETAAAKALSKAGAQVKRQHMGNLQHNKFIVADGQQVKGAICGSTNFSWRGLFVQANNAIRLSGATAIKPFQDAFDAYWATVNNAVGGFDTKPPAAWTGLGFAAPNAQVTFSPHSAANAALEDIASDIRQNTTSSLLYSLAFLYQTPGSIKDAIKQVTQNPQRFVYGMSDRKVGGLDIALPGGNTGAVYPGALMKGVPPPFSVEPTGGSGIRLHHKFVVIDFDKPTARVYLGSYNFSSAADRSNGENLLVIRDQRVATSYAVEALALFDHYHFRVVQAGGGGKGKGGPITLRRPPSKPGEKPWFDEHWTVPYKIHDRLLFA